YVPEFTAAMNGLQKGQMTETPVKTQFGYHIIQVQDVRDAKMPSLEEVKPQLMQMLQQDQNLQRAKFEEMLKVLRAKAKIQ
ncbi:MAG: peptidyl-prolyl cis-trans isomerase, partial [Burkholderiales bacterium]|nr:peptidyl-prolyl cis-trans isomerase [Burkholderiales bacterium]